MAPKEGIASRQSAVEERDGEEPGKPYCLLPTPYCLPNWWAWEDSNFRPHAYQARALTN